MNALELTGRARTHIIQIENPRFAVHPEVVEPFFAMVQAAKKAGILITPFSSFRDFKTQLRIWNKKFSGEKPLYDMHGFPRNYSVLSESEIIDAILNWSALPGASRHHWGTEIDVIDAGAIPQDYQVQLLPQEVEPGGVFYQLHCWLNENMERFGFFRPYREYRGGMYPEPWHLSYARVSIPALESLSLELLEWTIQASNIKGKQLVLKRLPEIYQHHVLNINF
ncbi:M15 family metallopeptidase [Microseira sp. BLCC-F43]|jgi:LAS superfamily LD-carboxypeptidase LdcB|uniref:M15 family metallopeptidase n=1 Tax=Microseira sp. BLCC-F43 TaxID=3153602 RepID=UPI0035B9EF3F